MDADDVLVELQDVSVTHPGSPAVVALDRASLTIGAGERIAIVGPSGSGKTTLLSVMSTLAVPTGGTVRITARLADWQRASLRAGVLGFVFQQFHLLPGATTLENVALGMQYAGRPRRDRLERSRELLEQVGLGHRTSHRPGELSGGEQQRVAIARALGGRPRVLFADEPTGALDTATGTRIVDLLAQTAGTETAVVIITHDADLADRMPRRIRLRDGRIISDERTRP
jgi:putative ABC transport system ATP-binding protein